MAVEGGKHRPPATSEGVSVEQIKVEGKGGNAGAAGVVGEDIRRMRRNTMQEVVYRVIAKKQEALREKMGQIATHVKSPEYAARNASSAKHIQDKLQEVEARVTSLTSPKHLRPA